MSAPRSGLLASRFVENRFQVALTAVFVGWGGFLAMKKLTRNTPEEMRHDPLFEVDRSQKEVDEANEDPATVKLAKKTGMIVTARPGDPSADPIAAASGGAPLVTGIFPNASITKGKVGEATPAARRAAEKEAEWQKK